MLSAESVDLDPYLAQPVRRAIEERYYARTNAQARFEASTDLDMFFREPYTALWADHGVVHVRDVASNVLHVLDLAQGVLLPARSPSRRAFMRAYGVMTAYVHDIGMIDFTAFGRRMHPEFAAQAVMSAQFDDLIEQIWKDTRNPVVVRLKEMAKPRAVTAPRLVLRELLALAICHSKSKVPIEWLNDPPLLRAAMQETIRTDLKVLYRKEMARRAQRALATAQEMGLDQTEVNQRTRALHDAENESDKLAAPPTRLPLLLELRAAYPDFERDAYRWLVLKQPKARAFARDVIDTLRALRCADALRQRGAVLKTSGQYEIFMDHRHANAIYALRLNDERLFLLEVPEYIGAGESNVASSELDRDGNLRISFHRGSFGSAEALQRALYSAALVVNDLHSDVVESFKRPGAAGKRARKMEILLETADDNLEFAEQVVEPLRRVNPRAAARARTVPSLKHVPQAERDLYLQAERLRWTLAQRRRALDRISRSGHKTAAVDPCQAFEHVKLIELAAGAVLIEPGTPAAFVYIPLGDGLEIAPLGGYAPLPAQAWVPLGITGVIRGAPRNARVTARAPVQVLMIPKEVYIKHWHSTYSPEELRTLLSA